MRPVSWAAALLGCAATLVSAEKSNTSEHLSSQNILPAFKPSPVFKNANLVHIISLEKGYPKETVNVVIENISNEPQDEYYIPFTAEQMEKIGDLEVRDKKVPELGLFAAEAAEIDTESDTHYYRIRLPEPLPAKGQQTLSITYGFLSSLHPIPKSIDQNDKQYLTYIFSAYWPSAYTTSKQKTEIKFPGADIPDYTTIPASGSTPELPQKQGTKFTYGSFGEVPAGAVEPVRVRYEFTKPIIHVSKLERDIEISHWGGNAAFEERYTLHNKAANLSQPFNRVKWAQASYYSPATTAIKELRFPLKVGSLTPYFTDVIGNVSTSRFRSNKREANLEIKPRYPVFGGWNYPFRVGWDADLKSVLRRLDSGTYVLKVPFLEGPKQAEGVSYEEIEVRVILPEGATSVKYQTTVPITSESITLHRTFMDTIGRTTLTLRARNVFDEIRDREVVVTYEYPFVAGLRKPLVIAASIAAVFVAAWAIGSLDVGIRGRRFTKSS